MSANDTKSVSSCLLQPTKAFRCGADWFGVWRGAPNSVKRTLSGLDRRVLPNSSAQDLLTAHKRLVLIVMTQTALIERTPQVKVLKYWVDAARRPHAEFRPITSRPAACHVGSTYPGIKVYQL